MGEDGKDEALRDAVCDAFAELLTVVHNWDGEASAQLPVHEIGLRYGVPLAPKRKMATVQEFQAALRSLASRARAGEQLTLLCWCHPRRCHTHEISAVLEQW
ncbi:unnamed protein product [Effrenium voratum]|nr:unnamed protein product [Effrenium voratum]